MELRLSEALGNELPEISRAINLKEILAATWGRNASVLVGQRFPGAGESFGIFTQIRVVSGPTAPHGKSILKALFIPSACQLG